MGLQWTLGGPWVGPCDFRDFFRLFLLFLQSNFSKPSKHYRTYFWSLWYFPKAQGTLLDLQGDPNGPLDGPCQADFWVPFVKKDLPGSPHGPNWSIFLHKPKDNGQTQIYSLV